MKTENFFPLICPPSLILLGRMELAVFPDIFPGIFFSHAIIFTKYRAIYFNFCEPDMRNEQNILEKTSLNLRHYILMS